MSCPALTADHRFCPALSRPALRLTPEETMMCNCTSFQVAIVYFITSYIYHSKEHRSIGAHAAGGGAKGSMVKQLNNRGVG